MRSSVDTEGESREVDDCLIRSTAMTPVVREIDASTMAGIAVAVKHPRSVCVVACGASFVGRISRQPRAQEHSHSHSHSHSYMHPPTSTSTSTQSHRDNMSSAATSSASPTLGEDLSKLLSSSQFSVASYLNAALKDQHRAMLATTTPAEDELVRRRMAELALQLQLQTQSCHEEIGRIGAELQAILPRCAADVGRVGVGLEGMRIDAKALLDSTSLHGSGNELSSSLETLSTLHALQANLGRTKEVLVAATTWDATLASIPPLLADEKLTDAVNALAVLESGERSLRGMPNLQERRDQIAKIRQQVQILLQPQLKHALQGMNTRLAPLQQCVLLFAKLNKMDSLREEYVKSRPDAIHKAWFAFRPSYNAVVGDDAGAADQNTASATTGNSSNSSNSSNNRPPASSGENFITWLPSWYDAVLTLLNEEKRQSTTVFGAEDAAEMIAKVFKECFRPILPSFRSRLESIYSSSVSAHPKGSFQSICAVYESSIRFLVVVYEIIAGTFLDAVDSGAVASDNTGIDLYQQLMTTFAQVAAPFTNYIVGFAKLENKHFEATNQSFFRTMQQTVSQSPASNDFTNIDALQHVIHELKETGNVMFPKLDMSLERFALMDGGFRPKASLAAVDKNVATYIGEVAVAVRTLSANLTANTAAFADVFDEQHILCAMEILKMAGSIHRRYNQFQTQSKDKINALADRMAGHVGFGRMLIDAAEGNSKTFTLPESTSLAEIDSILIESACGDDDKLKDVALASLREIVEDNATTTPSNVRLLSQANQSVRNLKNSCQAFVFDVCSCVAYRHLHNMSAMECWRSQQPASGTDAYGTLPQTYVNGVGEHMLALVQYLEPLTSDQDLIALANEVMSDIHQVSLSAWERFVGASGILGDDTDIAKQFMEGTSIAEYVKNNEALGHEEYADEITDEEKHSAEFCSAWLGVVALAVAGRILEEAMRFPSLTQKGCEHLMTDLEYLKNVLIAVGVTGHPHPMLCHLSSLVAMEGAELVGLIGTRDRGNRLEEAMATVETRIALLRGFAVNN